jgi:hypothetical protein
MSVGMDGWRNSMSVLWEKRALFTKLLPMLINKMIFEGYVPLLGKDGLKHKIGSLHYEGLAVDIDLFKGGVYLEDGKDHIQFGEYWESLHPDCANGRSWDDSNHYSIKYMGRK